MPDDRIRCLVPFCKRTTKRIYPSSQNEEWICQNHWRAVPKGVRAEFYAAKRKLEKNRVLKNWNAYYDTWDACKSDAIGSMV